MADEEQRDFGIDLAESLLRDADGNDTLIESDQSGSESEVSVSENESDEEDVDRATVTTDSYEQVLDQLDGDVAEGEDDALE